MLFIGTAEVKWELNLQWFLYIPDYLLFLVVKITENIHGIDLFNDEDFNFVKSGTEKKTFQSFSLLIGHFAFLP